MTSSSTLHTPEARLAASVLLVRDTLSGPEIYVQERADSMQLYARMTVFPGGGVDDRDRVGQLINWQGPDTDWWAQHLHTTPDTARALVCAAVRETFEETGTLLAGHPDGSTVSDTTPYAQQRQQMESHELAFSDFMANNNLILRSDALRPWARWITPEGQSPRYDLSYFIARMPKGQETLEETREASSTGWFRPSTLLDGWRNRLIYFMPATWAQVKVLENFHSVDELMEFARTVTVDPVSDEALSDPLMSEYYLMETRMFETHEKFFAPGMKFTVDPTVFPDNPYTQQ